MIDEISLRFWKTNSKKVSSSKSFCCKHNGLTYGDDMICDEILFVYKDHGSEYECRGEKKGPKWSYYKLIETACQKSTTALASFTDDKLAEKFRIYSEEKKERLSDKQKNSTRITDDSCRININGNNYYVANNLKICEYFNNAANCIDDSELSKWYIRVLFGKDTVKGMVERDELDFVDEPIPEQFSLKLHDGNEQGEDKSKVTETHMRKTDFLKLNEIKKQIGDIGEQIVLLYEQQRLINSNKAELAKKIEHSSAIKGDGLGYDLISYEVSGDKIYIEVKATRQNTSGNFYLSKKEKQVAQDLYEKGEKYKIYRVFNIDLRKGTGDLVIYEPPFSEDKYCMEPENWHVLGLK